MCRHWFCCSCRRPCRRLRSCRTDTDHAAAAYVAWEAAEQDTPTGESVSRQRFTEESNLKIKAFLTNSELFLTLCNRPRDRWGYFVLSWLGSKKSDKVRWSHTADNISDCSAFREWLILLFDRFEFEIAYRASLRSLRQSGAKSIASYAASTTKYCSRAYADFTI